MSLMLDATPHTDALDSRDSLQTFWKQFGKDSLMGMMVSV